MEMRKIDILAVKDSFLGLRLKERPPVQRALILGAYAAFGLILLTDVLMALGKGQRFGMWSNCGNAFLILGSLIATLGIFWEKAYKSTWIVFLMITVSSFFWARIIGLYIHLMTIPELENLPSPSFMLCLNLALLLVPLFLLSPTQKAKVFFSWFLLLILFTIIQLLVLFKPDPLMIGLALLFTLALIFFPRQTVVIVRYCVFLIEGFIVAALLLGRHTFKS